MQQDVITFVAATIIVIGAILGVSLPALLRKKKSETVEQDAGKKKK